MIKKLIAGSAVLSISGLALVGCTSASAQTEAEACAVVEEAIIALDNLDSSSYEFPIDDMKTIIQDTTESVTNEKVSKAWKAFADPSLKIVDVFEKFSEEDLEELNEEQLESVNWDELMVLGNEVEEGANEVISVCSNLDDVLGYEDVEIDTDTVGSGEFVEETIVEED